MGDLEASKREHSCVERLSTFPEANGPFRIQYAGEISLQAGLALAALPSCPSIPYALLALGSPVLTYLLLTKVSGIPMVEPESAKRHGKNWENYANKVPMLWPWGKTGLWRE